jgi:hypothetical protein
VGKGDVHRSSRSSKHLYRRITLWHVEVKWSRSNRTFDIDVAGATVSQRDEMVRHVSGATPARLVHASSVLPFARAPGTAATGAEPVAHGSA